MSSEKRFPSDANRGKTKPQAKPAPVRASQQTTVEVHYNRENHHRLNNVYALAKGVNHVPAQMWQQVRQHPTIIDMINQGHIIVPSEKPADPAQASE